MISPLVLRNRLAAGERLTGALVRMPAEETVEMLAVAGFDFVLLDCEHGPADIADLRRHVASAAAFGMPLLARPARGDSAFVLRALDGGAVGIVAPHVESAAEAALVVRAARYPPHGERGFATYSRAGRYGTVAAAEHRSAADASLVLVMLESPAAVRDAAAIVGVPGVDGFLVGTSDLAASRGPEDPPLEDLLALAARTGSSVGALRAELASDPAQAAAAFEGGARMVVYNLTQAFLGLLGQLRAVR